MRLSRFQSVCGLVVALVVAVEAQELPVAVPPPAGHETEAQTIGKCLADMRSPDAKIRHRAILVLGKYRRSTVAMEAVVAALADESPEVRRSALVSLDEEGGPMMLRVQPKVYPLLLDEDVHIRRIASSMLPSLSRPNFMRLRRPVDSLPTARPMTPEDKEAAAILKKALKDEDAVVRRNILRFAPRSDGMLEAGDVEARFADSDREVRVLALRARLAMRIGSQADFAAVLAPLAKDEDQVIRREAAIALGRCGEDGLEGLRLLVGDAVDEVRLTAATQLLRLQDGDSFARIETLIDDPASSAEGRAKLIPSLAIYGTAALPLLKRLAQSQRTVLRVAAVRSLGSSRFKKELDNEFFFPLLKEEQADLRAAAVSALLYRGGNLGEADVRRMMDSEYPNVRSAALRVAQRLPQDKRGEFFLDACLDDDVQVRCNALRQVAFLHLPDAAELIIQSYEDPDPKVRKTVLEAIHYLRTPSEVEYLRKHLLSCDDRDLKNVIMRVLARKRPRPPVRTFPPRVLPPARTP